MCVCACVYVEGTQLVEEARGRVSLRKSGEEARQEGQQDPKERALAGPIGPGLLTSIILTKMPRPPQT